MSELLGVMLVKLMLAMVVLVMMVRAMAEAVRVTGVSVGLCRAAVASCLRAAGRRAWRRGWRRGSDIMSRLDSV